MACPRGKACPQLFDASDTILDKCEGDFPDLVHFDIPSILIEIDAALQRDALEEKKRRDSEAAGEKTQSDEESESTAL